MKTPTKRKKVKLAEILYYVGAIICLVLSVGALISIFLHPDHSLKTRMLQIFSKIFSVALFFSFITLLVRGFAETVIRVLENDLPNSIIRKGNKNEFRC